MKNFNQLLIKALTLVALLGCYAPIASAEFGTLFTTASERNVIDENRYVIKRVKTIKPKETTVAKIEVEEPQKIIYQRITKEFKISGLSISRDGVDSAWVNGKVYEHGEALDSKIRMKVNASQRNVRFIVRGGKTFYGKSGDTVVVTYNVPITE